MSENLLVVEAPVVILPSHGTVVRCTGCGTTEAAAFYVKRRRGLYALLCFRNGDGCWERSARTLCSYIGPYQDQCTSLAEYELVPKHGRYAVKCCAEHLALLLPQDSDVTRVHPLED